MMSLSVRVSVNRNHVGKHPPDMPADESARWFAQYNDGFTNEALAPEAVLAAIQDGFGLTAQHRGRRKAENFIQGQVLGLDFDHHGLSGVLETIPWLAEIAYALHHTASHTPEAPRCRALIFLDRPVQDKALFGDLSEGVNLLIGISDAACKDPSRLFYGAPGCEVLTLGNVLPLETAVQRFVEPLRQRRASQIKAAAPPPGLIDRTTAGPLIESLVNRVLTAPDGEKHSALLGASVTMGRLVAAGYLSETEAQSIMLGAILQRSIDNPRGAERTIQDGLRYGLGHGPLWTHADVKNGEETAAREALRQAVEYGYHRGMAQAGRARWHSRGLTDGLIDLFGLGWREPIINQETGEILVPGAYAIPFRYQGKVYDVEYWGEDGRVSYEKGASTLFLPDPAINRDEPLVLLPDVAGGMHYYLHLGTALPGYRVAACPTVGLTRAIRPPTEVIFVHYQTGDRDPLGPNRDAWKGRAWEVELPVSIERLAKEGPGRAGNLIRRNAVKM